MKVSKEAIEEGKKVTEKSVKDIRASIEARNARREAEARAKESEGVEEVKGQISPATSPQPVHQLLHQLLHRSLLVRGSCMVRRYFVSLLGFDDGASAWVGGWLG